MNTHTIQNIDTMITEPSKSILFVCTGNTCRSPLAAAYAAKKFKDIGLNIAVDCAGLIPQVKPISDHSAKILKENNLEPIREVSQPIHCVANDYCPDLILTMSMSHVDEIESTFLWNPNFDYKNIPKIMTLKQAVEYDIPSPNIADPFMGSYEEYYMTWKEIETCVDRLVEILSDICNS